MMSSSSGLQQLRFLWKVMNWEPTLLDGNRHCPSWVLGDALEGDVTGMPWEGELSVNKSGNHCIRSSSVGGG